MRRATAALITFIFFLSGVAALIFETLWFRQAGIAFGNSVWAGALVLSSFMAGTAAGIGYIDSYTDRSSGLYGFGTDIELRIFEIRKTKAITKLIKRLCAHVHITPFQTCFL